MKPFLSVVIPVYNEKENFMSGRLGTTLQFLKLQKYSWELLFVDDGSTDNSKRLLEKLAKRNKNIKVLTIPHGGKMKAVYAGAMKARGKYILFADFDQSTPIHYVDNFLIRHKRGADIVIGLRGYGPDHIKHDSLYRKFRSLVFLYLAKALILWEIEDYFCGFKSFTKESVDYVFRNLKASNFEKMQGAYMGAWDVEALFIAKRAGFKIAQEPVDWYKIKSIKLDVIKEPLLILLELFKIRWFAFKGEYSRMQ